MRRFALFFVITLCHVSGFEVEAPQNTFSLVGQTAFFKCRAANRSTVHAWKFKRNSDEHSNVINIISGANQPTINCQKRCSVAGDQNGFSVLSYNDTMMEDGVSYICRIQRDGNENEYGAELVVLDANSQCELKTSDKTISDVIMEGNYLEIVCNFSFSGNMVPLIKWFRNSSRISLPLHQADSYVDGIHWFQLHTTLQLNASDNGMVFGYEVDFERSNVTGSTQTTANQATNALSNVFRWNFTAVVWYMPRNIRIASVKTIYDFGDRLKCSADGNPPPNYLWSCDAGTTQECSLLTLDADTFHANEDYACQCIAMSSIFSANVSETVIIRIAYGTEWKNKIIGVIVGILAAVIFAVLMALCFKGFLCCSANKNPDIVQHHEDHSKTPDTSNESTEIAVYAEVRKPLTDQDDAVIYLDLKGGKSILGKSPPVALPTMSQTAEFNQSEYAAIDHALQSHSLKKRNN